MPSSVTKLIFVFGSNLAGRHGAGAARTAVQFRGAIYGQGVGRQGNAYAIPTKDCALNSLPLDEIRLGVAQFIDYARAHPELEFQVTMIGCGLAGYSHLSIAPMFAMAPLNCLFDTIWQPWLGERRYWGHHE